MSIGFVQLTLEVLEGGVQATEIPPFIQQCIFLIMIAAMTAAALKIIERTIEAK